MLFVFCTIYAILFHPLRFSSKNGSLMKRYHLLLPVMMTILLLMLMTEAVIRNSAGSSGKVVEDAVCQDKKNHEKANRLIDYPALNASIYWSADPCVDFYAFVCNGWQNITEISDDYTSFNQFLVIGRTIEKQMEELFADRSTSLDSRSPYDALMYGVYDACMENETRNAKRSQPLLDRLAKLYEAKQSLTDWWLEAFPLKAFYTLHTIVNVNETDRQILEVALSGQLIIEDKHYLIDAHYAPKLASVRHLLERTLWLLAEDEEADVGRRRHVPTFFDERVKDRAAEIRRRVDAFFHVETMKARIFHKSDKHYNNPREADRIMTVSELNRLAPSMNWTRIFAAYVPPEVAVGMLRQSGGKQTVALSTSTELVDYDALPVLVNNVKLLQLIDAEVVQRLDDRTLSDYLDWVVIDSIIVALDDRFIAIYMEFKELPSRSKICRYTAQIMFGLALERRYVERFFVAASTARRDATEMFERLRDTFFEMLTAEDGVEAKWMDSETRRNAREKLASLKFVSGYQEELFNDIALQDRISTLNQSIVFNTTNFVELLTGVIAWQTRDTMRRALEPVLLTFSAMDVNAFYIFVLNSVVIPAALMSGVFYNETRSRALNYGSLGTILAHEITHGYDNSGRLHDAQGRVRQWWREGTAAEFNRRKQCLIDQYSNYTVPYNTTNLLMLDGERMQGENIADNGGIRIAFAALERYLATSDAEGSANEADVRVRGLENLDARQLFFVSYAFSWCSVERPETIEANVLTDKHAPARARVNLPLANLPAFAAAFQCAADAPMNPPVRCAVW